jgi:hypothetical protein
VKSRAVKLAKTEGWSMMKWKLSPLATAENTPRLSGRVRVKWFRDAFGLHLTLQQSEEFIGSMSIHLLFQCLRDHLRHLQDLLFFQPLSNAL